MRILLAEDEVILGEQLQANLASHYNTVDWVKNGLAAWSAVQTEHFDLLILDIGLPKMSGMEVIKKLRANNIFIPVIMLTSRSDVKSRIEGLDSGVDDYLPKPFDCAELISRINAVARRASKAYTTPNTLTTENVSLNTSARLTYKDNKLVSISRREFSLLSALILNANKVLTRDQAAQSVYGWGCDIDSNALEVHIHNIRKKLGLDNIKTVRGVGYMLEKQ